MRDARFHGTTDPAPGTALADIHPLSARARALIARSKTHPALASDFPRVNGAAEMLDGLQYHFDNYLQHRAAMRPHDDAVLAYQRAVTSGAALDETVAEAMITTTALAEEALRKARHEVIAYLNVLGRFYYFARKLQHGFRRVADLLSVRNKVTAHRSVDDPRRESQHLQDMQAMALSSVAGHQFSFPSGRAQLSFQVKVDDAPPAGTYVDVCLEQDHEVVAAEVYAVLEELLR